MRARCSRIKHRTIFWCAPPAAGAKVAYKHYDGVTHELSGLGAVLDQSKDATQFAAKTLMQAFNRTEETAANNK